MKISKNTWHYKMVTERFCYTNGWRACNNLCLYFWQVVARFLMGFALGLLAISPVVTVIAIITNYMPPLVTPFVATGLTFAALCMIAGVIFIWEKTEDLIRHTKWKRKSLEPKEKKPNLLIEYIKAKKEKMCPIIEFEKD